MRHGAGWCRPLAQQGVETAAARLGGAHAHLVQPVFHIGQGIGQVHTHLWNLVQHAASGCQPVLHALNFSIELFMRGSAPLFCSCPLTPQTLCQLWNRSERY